jgi:hypothetical protein
VIVPGEALHASRVHFPQTHHQRKVSAFVGRGRMVLVWSRREKVEVGKGEDGGDVDKLGGGE